VTASSENTCLIKRTKNVVGNKKGELFMDPVFKERYERILKGMQSQGWDGVVLWPSANLFYVTGYAPKPDERLQVAIIPASGSPVLIVPKLYANHAKEECWIADQRDWRDGDDLYALVADVIEEMGLRQGKIAIDDTMGFTQADPFLKACPKGSFGLASSVFTPLRNIKGALEISLMEKSGIISDEVMPLAIAACAEGKTELEIKDFVEVELKKRGMAGPFSNLIASGANSANPHHVSGDRVPAQGDMVFLDLGGAYKKYWSDITRTICIGTPTEKMREAYKQVQEAQELAKAAVRPGVPAEEVHRVAYNHLAQKGLEKYFIHRTGHGMGLDGHELPSINFGNKMLLEPGMVFSVEPGVYFPGEFGIRIEDSVVVSEKGYQSFNHFRHDLICL
jgi:Xaa-Pro aminopeptidase